MSTKGGKTKGPRERRPKNAVPPNAKPKGSRDGNAARRLKAEVPAEVPAERKVNWTEGLITEEVDPEEVLQRLQKKNAVDFLDDILNDVVTFSDSEEETPEDGKRKQSTLDDVKWQCIRHVDYFRMLDWVSNGRSDDMDQAKDLLFRQDDELDGKFDDDTNATDEQKAERTASGPPAAGASLD
ncbi:unnamed protein product [Darwinula stevensoni]|uniref:Uncharacterized protein n=1 Tax=Darwinula stevensoni TaxID=69355 RepID=A0A7R9AJ87_9CRUS|nr:unnamed protein product [Darwinula stevensoni]CAG0907068.1 unnamed protein product [Darwinula stevensoni]